MPLANANQACGFLDREADVTKILKENLLEKDFGIDTFVPGKDSGGESSNDLNHDELDAVVHDYDEMELEKKRPAIARFVSSSTHFKNIVFYL